MTIKSKKIQAVSALMLLAVSISGCPDSSDPDMEDTGDEDPVSEHYTEEEAEECALKVVKFDLPFVYDASGSEMRLKADNEEMIPTSMTPWGAHVPPYTGHIEGNGKSDWAAWMALDPSEMVLLDGMTNSLPCPSKNHVQNQQCGMPLQALKDKNPPYVAFTNGFRVKNLTLEDNNAGISEASGAKKWRVVGNACNLRFTFVHVGYPSELLRQRMIAKGYKDPNTVTDEDVGVNLLDPEDPIMFSKGEKIAYPEIMATQVPGFDGYYQAGNLQDFIYPSSAIEYGMSDLTKDLTRSFPMFTYIEDETLRNKIYGFLADPFPAHLFESLAVEEWLWRAEAVPFTKAEASAYDYDSILSALGGWFENRSNCTFTTDAKCDDMFVIFPIHKDSAYYQANLYEDNVGYLVYRRTFNAGEVATFKNGVYGEVLTPATPGALSGTLSIKWRPTIGNPVYQKISYRVSPSQNRMRMRYSATTEDENEAIPDPAVPGENDACDGADVRCVDHQYPFG